MVEMSVAMNQTIGIGERSGLAPRRSVTKKNDHSQDMSKNIPLKLISWNSSLPIHC